MLLREVTCRITDAHSSICNSQTVCWAIIAVLTFPRSLHTSTSHQWQILTRHIRLKLFGNKTLKSQVSLRQLMMDSVLKSAKPHCNLTGNRSVFVHAWPGFTKVTWAPLWQFASKLSCVAHVACDECMRNLLTSTHVGYPVCHVGSR